MAEREKGTGKRILGRQNSRSEKTRQSGRRAPESGYLGIKIAGQNKTWRSGRRAPKTGCLGVKIASQKKTWRSGRRVPERGYLGVKIAGQKKTWRSGRWVVKREQTLNRKRAAGPGGQGRAEEEGTRNDKEPPTEEATKQLSVLGEHIPEEAKPETGQRKTLEVKYCKISSGIRTTPSNS